MRLAKRFERLRRLQFFVLLIVFGVLGVMPNTGVGPSIPNADLALHFLGWIVGAGSGRYAYPMAGAFLIGGGLWGYSLAIEIAQIAVPTRSFEVSDLMANALGIVTGLLLVRYLWRRPA